ncbi:universal stress protein [Angustibacter sp. McL0619]|uniref:universal stress protein n=1 Tax=Angustibacter sp. McL0619 TaxID=3415676 RepID=UPI003CECC07D
MTAGSATAERIVVGYIPSPQGIAAFERAKRESLLRSAPLVVVNTGHHGNYSDAAFATAEDLDAIDTELTSAGIEHDVQQPTAGRDAAEEILRVAAEQHATLIVIGIRYRTQVGKLLLGSTAQAVLLEATCPVLAVKGTRPA